ncbi:unnamed protein product [Rangifer tarandus platyrhynchus]|uniref:Uncharacterized protein n=1 Tax=Rangifer tarandus platyrhynchus TaxID=3082113 RepID=A0AC59ZZ37_RANTA
MKGSRKKLVLDFRKPILDFRKLILDFRKRLQLASPFSIVPSQPSPSPGLQPPNLCILRPISDVQILFI